MLPEVSELRHIPEGIVGYRYPWELDDAAFDGVHQREVAHRPGEQSSFGVARSAEEEGRGREVDNAGDAELPLYGLKAGDPEAGSLVVLFGFLPVVSFEVDLTARVGLLPVAVVRLIVKHEDVLQAHQIGHDA